MIRFFGVKLTPHATEFELFDRSFIEVLRRIKTNNPFLRGIVSEYASSIDYVYYTQDARKKGKSKFNINKYYDFAICGITQYSVILPRRIIVFCLVTILALLVEFFIVLLPNIAQSDIISIADSLIIRLIFAALLIFIILVCVIFEFVITMLNNSTEKPLVVEEKRINY